jgi:hypothetical protein
MIHEKLKITKMTSADIDFAHRVGAVTTKGNQTLLVRFFSRDLADDIMDSVKLLRGTGIIIYEDTPFLNRQLISNIKERDDVHACWMKNGTIWVRITQESKHF